MLRNVNRLKALTNEQYFDSSLRDPSLRDAARTASSGHALATRSLLPEGYGKAQGNASLSTNDSVHQLALIAPIYLTLHFHSAVRRRKL
ncbi:MAG: hypothetical protein ACYTX0_16740 [Nostoc sp.]